MVRHRVVAVLALVVLLGLSSAAGSAAAEERPKRGGPERSKVEPPGGKVIKAGWWWAGNQPPAETGLVAYPQQSPPNVPAGTLPVAAAAGEPEKISAIELRLKTDPGAATAESARVLLRESTAPGANSNAEAATILACPVTEAFWADGNGARWDAKPTYDCDLAQAEGVRRDNGRWVFDLTDLAALWLGESPTSPSFVLVEAADSPESFQVAFDGPAKGKGKGKGIRFEAVYLPVPVDEPGGEVTGGTPTGTVADAPTGGSLGSGSTGSSASGGLSGGTPASISDPGAAIGGTDAGAAGSPDKGTVSTASSPTTKTAPMASSSAVAPWHAGLTKPALLLLPFVLGLAYLAMVALGPDAQPSVATSRHGVGRALERLRQGTAKAIVRVGR